MSIAATEKIYIKAVSEKNSSRSASLREYQESVGRRSPAREFEFPDDNVLDLGYVPSQIDREWHISFLEQNSDHRCF